MVKDLEVAVSENDFLADVLSGLAEKSGDVKKDKYKEYISLVIGIIYWHQFRGSKTDFTYSQSSMITIFI